VERELGNSIMPGSLLLTLLRQLYQKIEHQAVVVFKAVKNFKNSSSLANKLINIAPSLNYAISQGLSTLDYEHFIQIHELAMKSVSYVSNLPIFSAENFASVYTNDAILRSNDFYTATENGQATNRTKPSKDMHFQNENNMPDLMGMNSSTYNMENMDSIDQGHHNDSTIRQTNSEGQTLTPRTMRSKDQYQDAVPSVTDIEPAQNMRFDDGNIQI
jgi:hypothetical protein